MTQQWVGDVQASACVLLSAGMNCVTIEISMRFLSSTCMCVKTNAAACVLLLCDACGVAVMLLSRL